MRRAILSTFFIAFCTLADAYSVTKGGPYENYPTEVISTLSSAITGYLERRNTSLYRNAELESIWENAVQDLKNIILEEPDLLMTQSSIPPEDDVSRNATELVTSKGLAAEEHFVTTVDGFVLFILRIKNINVSQRHALPIFLQHGLLSSCDCFLNNLRNESLAYILADMGYDVWLGNIRGNRYSSKHVRLQPTDKEFWEWSFDEMGQYDIPVMIDYILAKTDHQKLVYIGHSQGTLNLITSVVRHGQPLIEKIDKFIALAPAVYVSHAKGLMRRLGRFARYIQEFWDHVDHGDIFAHDGILSRFAKDACPSVPTVCSVVLHTMVGTGTAHFNVTRIPVYLSHAPAGTSTQNMVHWSQQMEDNGNSLKYYDYGSKWENFKHYRRFTPPEYDLSKFIVPMYAYFGNLDYLVTPPDAEALMGVLPNLKYAKIYSDYNHIDPVWGYNIANTTYRDILEILDA